MPAPLFSPQPTALSRTKPGAVAPDGQLERIAISAVQLAALGPQLATLAGRMEVQAETQARDAERIAAATRALTGQLGAVVERLQDASGNVHDVMGEIARIADQTRILSINASIEAARAGEAGRAFNVVAREVQRLADQTSGSTQLIEERVQAIQGSVNEVAATVAESAEGTGESQRVTVRSVNTQVQVMAETAEGQRDGARSLKALGDQANRATEELLLAVGTFRLAVHEAAGDEIRRLAPALARLAGRPELEIALHDWLAGHPGFELLYVTNPGGRQITGNIGWKEGRPFSDGAALGRDWQERPWFRDAMQRAGELVASDIYRSAATGDFCFTLSIAVHDAAGCPRGVLGADVNFQKLVAG